MSRCIFRKPKRRLKLSQGHVVITVMLGAALCLELRPQLNPYPSTLKGTPLLGESGTMERWKSNSWSSSLQ